MNNGIKVFDKGCDKCGYPNHPLVHATYKVRRTYDWYYVEGWLCPACLEEEKHK